jgi:hypothetical protein
MGTVTVLGGIGDGYLYFGMTANGESFNGSSSSEYMDSRSGVTSTAGSVALSPGSHEGVRRPVVRSAG